MLQVEVKRHIHSIQMDKVTDDNLVKTLSTLPLMCWAKSTLHRLCKEFVLNSRENGALKVSRLLVLPYDIEADEGQIIVNFYYRQ